MLLAHLILSILYIIQLVITIEQYHQYPVTNLRFILHNSLFYVTIIVTQIKLEDIYMAFVNENNISLINDEQKIRIALSKRAKLIMAEDMDIFGVNKVATFINTVFDNYKYEAQSSISQYLQQKKSDLNNLFNETKLDTESKKLVINQLLSLEENTLNGRIKGYMSPKADSKLYHINNSNVQYLIEECAENIHYNNRPGLYIRSVIEEYCSLPFITRESIYRKDIYDTIEQACNESRILKVKANYYGKDQLFYVYPYKILPDSFNTQSYLVCYSHKVEESESEKVIASFSMARIKAPTMLKSTFSLKKDEITALELQLNNNSPAYLIGKTGQIKVKLTEKGKQSYQSRLYSRPDKIESLSSDDIYVFDCTQQQIFNYFFSFGPEAEIISPENLRNRFINTYENALKSYNKSNNI